MKGRPAIADDTTPAWQMLWAQFIARQPELKAVAPPAAVFRKRV